MKILILDDDDIRHEFFATIYAEHDVRHARTYFKFLNQLQVGSPWDLIHLDHDLGDLQSGDSYVDGWGKAREYNGQHAARDICELPDERLPHQVIIQSVNPDGARAMLQMLQRRGVAVSWQPFGESSTILGA